MICDTRQPADSVREAPEGPVDDHCGQTYGQGARMTSARGAQDVTRQTRSQVVERARMAPRQSIPLLTGRTAPRPHFAGGVCIRDRRRGRYVR